MLCCSAPWQKRSTEAQSAVFSDQLVRPQAQTASEADFENSCEQGEYGTQHAWVPAMGSSPAIATGTLRSTVSQERG